MSVPLLRIHRLSVTGRSPCGEWLPTVRKVSFDVHPGEVVALIGGSGAGKTTVALTALGYARPGTRVTGGKVMLDGVDLLTQPKWQRQAMRGRDVAYVAQSAQAALNPALTIGTQVAESLVLHGLAAPAEAWSRATDMLAKLDLPNPALLAERYPHQASGGQQQRVIAAMALICGPRLLVLDEPTTALDVTTQIEVLRAIKSVIQDHGSAAIYVSHDLAVVAQIADRIVVMKDGSVVEAASTADIIQRPSTPYTRQLIGAARHQEANSGKPAPPSKGRGALIEIDGIYCSYRRPHPFQPAAIEDDILHDVTLEVRPREVVAVVGESGSGKSTLARVVAGLHAARAGTVRLDGRSLAPSSRHRAREDLRRIQIIFQSQDLSLNPEQKIDVAIGRPLQLYFGLKGAARARRVAELLDMVDLPADFAARYPGELSGGQRQRVAIARAFAAKPDIVLCDEILSSLDTIVATQVLELMRRLKAETDVAYLFISHDLATVASIADRVVVLYGGRLCEVGPTATVFRPPHHPYTALLLSSVPLLQQGWLEDVLKSRSPIQAQSGNRLIRDEGCCFRTRCAMALPGVCDRLPPPARATIDGRMIFCHQEIGELHKLPSIGGRIGGPGEAGNAGPASSWLAAGEPPLLANS